jgi:hypothetical protein
VFVGQGNRPIVLREGYKYVPWDGSGRGKPFRKPKPTAFYVASSDGVVQPTAVAGGKEILHLAVLDHSR